MTTYTQRWPSDISPNTCKFTRSRNDIDQSSPRTRQESFIAMGRPLWQAELTWLLPNTASLAKLMYFLEALSGFKGSVCIWDFAKPYPLGVVSTLPTHWALGSTVTLAAAVALNATSVQLSGLQASVTAVVQGQNIQVGHRIYQAKTTVVATSGGLATIYLATPMLEAVPAGDPVRLAQAATEMRLLNQNFDESSQAGQGLIVVSATFLETVADFAPSWILDAGDGPNGSPTLDIDFRNDRAYNAGASVSIASLLACARASTGFYTKADGTLVSFGNNVLRYGTNGLLLEESRTNILLRSQEFDNAAWTTSIASITANATTAPDGTATADKIVEAAATNSHYTQQNPVIGLGAVYSISVYAKAAERSAIELDLYDAGAAHLLGRAQFNLATGAVISNSAGTASITALANGWYHCKIAGVAATAATGAGFAQFFVLNGSFAANYAGDGTSGLYLWGAQLEAGAFITSYIPTTTSGASRAQDVVTFSDLTWFDPLAESVYAEWTDRTNVTVTATGLWNFGSSNSWSIGVNSGGAAGMGDAHTVFFLSGVATATGITNKTAFRLAPNDAAGSQNGSTATAITTAQAAAALSSSTLGLEGIWNNSNAMNTYLRRVAAFKSTLLSNTALKALSTL